MEDDFGRDNSASNATRASGSKRSFGDFEDDDNDISVSKKGCTKVDECLRTAMVLSLRESLQNLKDEFASHQVSFSGSLQNLKDEYASREVLLSGSLQECKDELASCQNELESAKAEISKWKSAFQNESFVPARKSPEPQFVIDYIQTLRSSDKSLKEELEIAQMKLAIRDLKSELKTASMKDELQAANAEIAHLSEVQAVRLDEMKKEVEYLNKLFLQVQKLPGFPSLVPPPAPEGDDVHK